MVMTDDVVCHCEGVHGLLQAKFSTKLGEKVMKSAHNGFTRGRHVVNSCILGKAC